MKKIAKHTWQAPVNMLLPCFCACGAEKKRNNDRMVYRANKTSPWSRTCPPCTKEKTS